jgi:translocation and assembly module TamA
VRVHLFIKTEHKNFFGPSTIVGNERVKEAYIEGKKAWKETEVYDNRKVEKTQQDLLSSGLFSSVFITHAEVADANGELAMKIDVGETKHHTLNLGVSYQTVFGPGITFGWENRNIAGMGRRVNFQGDITRISQTGLATYTHPEFLRKDQDFIWQAQAAHEALFAYSMRSYNVMQRLDRRFNEHLRGAFSIEGERLYVTASVDNGNYWLLEFPIYVRYSTANDLLNPSKGVIVEFTTTPVFNIPNLKQSYLVQEISQSSYFSLTKNDSVVLAEQLTLGLLWSDRLGIVPLSKRFLGGSEQELRGYRYRTVSPLKEGKPEGGRSAIYFTLESRFRISRPIGLVPFFDIGNVYTSQIPSAHGKWLKSVGLGLRYFSFMGPFRVDLAFPLNRRKGIDSVYRILASIGQTF